MLSLLTLSLFLKLRYYLFVSSVLLLCLAVVMIFSSFVHFDHFLMSDFPWPFELYKPWISSLEKGTVRAPTIV